MLPTYVREKACALGSGANSGKEAAVVDVLSGEEVRKSVEDERIVVPAIVVAAVEEACVLLNVELVVGEEEVALLVDVIVGWTVELGLAVLVVTAIVVGSRLVAGIDVVAGTPVVVAVDAAVVVSPTNMHVRPT